MTNQEQRNQVAAQLEAVAKRLRAGEDVGASGDLSAMWIACNGEDDPNPFRSLVGAQFDAQSAINDAGTYGDGTWSCEMHEIGWGLTVWVERAQARNVGPNVCHECEGEKDVDGVPCPDCDGTNKGLGDYTWECDYKLAPIPPNAVLCSHREGPDTIESDRGES